MQKELYAGCMVLGWSGDDVVVPHTLHATYLVAHQQVEHKLIIPDNKHTLPCVFSVQDAMRMNDSSHMQGALI